MPTFSDVQQPIVCWKCKAVVVVARDQLRSASCNICGSWLSPDGRIVTFNSFLQQQRNLREGSEAGALTESEVEVLTEALSDIHGDPNLPEPEFEFPEVEPGPTEPEPDLPRDEPVIAGPGSGPVDVEPVLPEFKSEEAEPDRADIARTGGEPPGPVRVDEPVPPEKPAFGKTDLKEDVLTTEFGDLRQTRTAVWGAVGMLVAVFVANLVFLGVTTGTSTIGIIELVMIMGLLTGKRWGRIGVLIVVGLSLVLFSWYASSEGDLTGGLLQFGLLGPVVLLLTGTSSRNRLTLGFGVFAAAFVAFLVLNVLTFNPAALAAADCFDLPDRQSTEPLSNVPRADCAGEHDVEVFAVIEHPDADGSYPGQAEVMAAAPGLCLGPFEVFVGTPHDETVLNTFTISPSRQAWQTNTTRSIVCGVFRPDGEKLIGSVEGRGGEFDPAWMQITELVEDRFGRSLTTRDLDELKVRVELLDSFSTCDELILYFDTEFGEMSEAEGQIQGFILGAGVDEFSDGSTRDLVEECLGDSQ